MQSRGIENFGIFARLARAGLHNTVHLSDHSHHDHDEPFSALRSAAWASTSIGIALPREYKSAVAIVFLS